MNMQHDIAIIRSPIAVIARCSCGWSRSQTRRQNARARQAKLDAEIRKHEFETWRAALDCALSPTQPPASDSEARRFWGADYGAGSAALLIAEERHDSRKSQSAT